MKIIFCGLSLEIWYNDSDSHFEEFRKQHCIADPLVALKIGRQTRYVLARDVQETEDFF